MRQLGPFAFDHSAHFIRDMVDVLYIEHVLVEALQVRRQHDLAADQAGAYRRAALWSLPPIVG